MSPPLVSIVTPVYNQAQWLEEAILSVLEQDYPHVEYIVVDDGSTDGSAEIVRRYADRLTWWTTQPNRGQVAAINLGFSRATGDVVGWLNSDDTYLPGTIARLARYFEEDPDLALVYGDAYYTDEESKRTGYLRAREWDVPAMIRTCECHVVQPGSLFGRRALERLEPMDESRHWFFDYELFLRLGGVGGVRHLHEPLATYRLHPESKSVGAPHAKARDYVRVADEFFVNEFLDEAGLSALRPHARSTAYLIAAEYFHSALDTAAARRYYLKAFARHPRNATPHTLSLAFRSLLPGQLVQRLRDLRGRLRRDGTHRH